MWMQQTLPLTQLRTTPGSSSEVRQTTHSSPSVKRPQQSLQMISPTIPVQIPAPPKSKLIVRKSVSEIPEQKDEELEQPARKKVKVTRPGVPPQSGSWGSQPQKWSNISWPSNFYFLFFSFFLLSTCYIFVYPLLYLLPLSPLRGLSVRSSCFLLFYLFFYVFLCLSPT